MSQNTPRDAREQESLRKLFDHAFYLAQNDDVRVSGMDPFLHFMEHGAFEGRSPHPLFDVTFYLAHHPDVAKSGLNPVLHFLRTGANTGANPHPLFDTVYYCGEYPDVASGGVNPLIHFIEHGTVQGRNPHPFFDMAEYLAANPDVDKSGANPLIHYISSGAKEGRSIRRAFAAPQKHAPTSETFFPGEAEWVTSHYYDVPNQTVEFCGDIADKSVLDLGCGDMVTDFGLLAQNVRKLTGLDLDARNPDHLLRAVERLQRQLINPPGDYARRLTYLHYDGLNFPFADEEFDFVFSWSAFEHVNDVPRVLAEIRRVLRDKGHFFAQVFPWYQCYWGSHLSDFISEPYFHLKHLPDWTRERLEVHYADRSDKTAAVMSMYTPYVTLNRYSANHFYRDVTNAGFEVVKARIITSDLDLSQAPPDVDFSDLAICGTKMLLRKKV